MLIVTEYLCDKWPRICSVCRNHNPVLSSCMTYHRMCSKSNMTGTTCGTTNPSGAHQFTRGTTYPSGAHQFTRGTTNHSGPHQFTRWATYPSGAHQFTRGKTYPSGAHQFTRGTTYPSGAHQFTRGTTYPSGAHQFTPAFSVIRVAQFLFFCAVFVYYCLSFFLWALQCLCFYWFTTADYPLVSSIYDCWLPFGIFYLRLLITFGIFYLRLLITLWYLLFTTTDYPLVSSIYDCWLPFGIFYLRLMITLWYLQTCLNGQSLSSLGRQTKGRLSSIINNSTNTE
jgi:hypothetical protein